MVVLNIFSEKKMFRNNTQFFNVLYMHHGPV